MENSRFKFRAWDSRTNQMSNEFVFINFKTKSIGFYAINSLGERKIFERNTDDSPLMQYTGLKDKNGIEIFEGDIVKYSFGGHRYKGIVKYSVENAMFEIKDRAFRNNLGFALDIEIIGNIYESRSF